MAAEPRSSAARRDRGGAGARSPAIADTLVREMDFALPLPLAQEGALGGFRHRHRAARAVVLRPAGLGGAHRRLRGHRQGRYPTGSLVPPGPRPHAGRRRARAALLDRHHVRIPHAGAVDEALSRAPSPARACSAVVRVQRAYARARACRGEFPNRPASARGRAPSPATPPSEFPAWRCGGESRRRW